MLSEVQTTLFVLGNGGNHELARIWPFTSLESYPPSMDYGILYNLGFK